MVTGSVPYELSRRTRTASPGVVTRAIMRTVALVMRSSPSVCWEVLQAVTQRLVDCPDADDAAHTIARRTAVMR